ncbi:MAG TPA: PQQ-binding-like beta-propeller repeat protein [Terriglobia bacterium]|nr:PQQ-binding-like beta-propeller repeat protein [Terriglobia bacterium]
MNKKLVAICTLLFMLSICAVLTAGDWPTFGHDPQRTGWASGEDALNPQNVSHLQLLWKITLKNEPKSLAALTAPVVADGVSTPAGSRSVVYVAGSSDVIFAIDAETGKVIWTDPDHAQVSPKNPGMWLCPNNLNATPTIDERNGVIYSLAADGNLYGLDLGMGDVKFGPVQFVPPFSKDWSLNFSNGIVYTTISQGCGGAHSGIYSMDVRDPMRPGIRDLMLQQGFGAGVWGRGGATIGKNGKIYAATGDGTFNPAQGDYGSSAIEAAPSSLKILDYYLPLNYRELTKFDLDMGASDLVWFSYRDFNLVAGGGKEGVLYMLNADSLGEKDHQTPLYHQKLSNDKLEYEQYGIWGGPSSRMDSDGNAWVYAPVWGALSKDAPKFPITNGPNPHGSIAAFKVAIDLETHKPTLEPAWVSADMDVPDPVAIANGVVFALSTGENTQQTIGSAVIYHGQKTLTDAQKSENTHRAVLYALDAKTGKVLYQSGGAIATWTHFSGLAIADGRVYVVDHGSNLYCFGLK